MPPGCWWRVWQSGRRGWTDRLDSLPRVRCRAEQLDLADACSKLIDFVVALFASALHSCEDVDAFCVTHKKNGGTVCLGPKDVPGMGRFAVLQDKCASLFIFVLCSAFANASLLFQLLLRPPLVSYLLDRVPFLQRCRWLTLKTNLLLSRAVLARRSLSGRRSRAALRLTRRRKDRLSDLALSAVSRTRFVALLVWLACGFVEVSALQWVDFGGSGTSFAKRFLRRA